MDGDARSWRWGLLAWFALCVAGAFACWWLVLLMVTFGCDSGWEGCETVGLTTVFVYAGLAAVGLIGLLIGGLVTSTNGLRVAVVLAMPLWVLASMLLAFTGYWLLARLAW